MNVVYSTDENYAFLAGISIISLFENNINEKVTVYIIADNISNENMRDINIIGEKYNQQIIFIEQPNIEEMVGIDMEVSNWSISAYVRLFLSDILPHDIDRVIWLDCDTIVTRSIRYLWDFDIADCLAAAVLDCSIYFKKMNGFDEEDSYYNSGILVIDLKKWREQNIQEKFISKIIELNGVSIDVDQGIINRVLKGKIHTLPEKYNVISLEYIWGIKKMNIKNGWDSEKEFYSYEERRNAMKEPVIIHFVGGELGCVRPWYVNCIHPRKDDFIKYKMISPWKNMKLFKKNVSCRAKIHFYLGLFFPRFYKILRSQFAKNEYGK